MENEAITLVTVTALVAGVVNIAKQAIPEGYKQYIPLMAIGLAEVLVFLWTGTIDGWNETVLYGLMVGLSAVGAYETVKSR